MVTSIDDEVPDSTYELAAGYLGLVRKTIALRAPIRALGPLQPVRHWINERRLRKVDVRRDRYWGNLCGRYQGVVAELHRESGISFDSVAEASAWLVLSGQVQKVVSLDKTLTCFPEIMWAAASSAVSPAPALEDRMRRKFHLRALLDEVPDSKAMGVLLLWAFSGGAGVPTDDALNRLNRGCAEFASYLYQQRWELRAMTMAVLTNSELEVPADNPARVRVWLVGF